MREPTLLLLDGPDARVVTIRQGLTRIGRSTWNELVLDDPSVSRLHSFLVRQGDEVRIHDAGSENGTRLGKESVDGRRLDDGDVLKFGRLKLRFSAPRPEPVPAPLPVARAVDVPRPSASAGRAWILAGLATSAFLVTIAAITAPLARRPAPDAAPVRPVPRPSPAPTALLPTPRPLERPAPTRRADVQPIRNVEVRPGPAEPPPAALPEPAVGPDPAPEPPAARPAPEPPAAPPKKSDESRVVVREPEPEPRPPVDPAEIERLAAAVRRVLENYASPSAKASDLTGPLSELVAIPAAASADHVLDLLRESREFLAGIDKDVAMLERREDRMLDQAERVKLSEGKAEDQQRLLELSARKAKILHAQRERLVPMVGALREAVRRIDSDEGTRRLARELRYATDLDMPLREAIVDALVAGRARHAVPTLIAGLSKDDPAWRQRLLEALRTITGADAGKTYSEWMQWWNRNKDKETDA